MALGDLIYPLPPELRSTVRKFEKCYIKYVKSDLKCAYNQACLTENILLKYTNIRLHDAGAERETFTLDFRKRLIQRQLEEAIHKVESRSKWTVVN